MLENLGHQKVTQAIVTEQAEYREHQTVERFALFDANHDPVKFGPTAVSTSTAIGTAAKTTTSAEPVAGSVVAVAFVNGNSAETPTLAFNGGTARAMKLGGTASAAAKLAVAANGVALFWFDGTVLHQIGAYT
jgi:hypothetical protein